MAKAKETSDEVETVFLIKEESEGGYSRAFSITEIKIDRQVLQKQGKVVSKTNPDLFRKFLDDFTEKARALFGI